MDVRTMNYHVKKYLVIAGRFSYSKNSDNCYRWKKLYQLSLFPISMMKMVDGEKIRI